MRQLSYALAIVVGLVMAAAATAQVNVTFDPNGFQMTNYRILDNPITVQIHPNGSGVRVLSMNDGNFLIQSGTFQIPFTVTGGVVSSGDVRITAAGTTVTFNPWPITIDPNGILTTSYRLTDDPIAVQVAGFGTGVRVIQLINGNYQVRFNGYDPIVISVAGGVVSSVDPRVTAGGSTVTVTQPTLAVTVDPNGMAATYRLTDSPVTTQYQGYGSGVRNFNLVDETYAIEIHSMPDLVFSVSGGVLSSSDPRLIIAGATITFDTTIVTVDPAGIITSNIRLLDAAYSAQVGPWQTGLRMDPLIDGAYQIEITSQPNVFFTLASGVTSSADTRVSTAGTVITFTINTTEVTVDPNGMDVTYRLVDNPVTAEIQPNGSGVRVFDLIDGNYGIEAGAIPDIVFSVASGTVSSSDPRVSVVGGTITFNTSPITTDPAGILITNIRLVDDVISRQVGDPQIGIRTNPLIDGDYRVDLPPSVPDVFFSVTGGTVSSTDTRVIAAGTTITFIPLVITVSPESSLTNSYRVVDNPLTTQFAPYLAGVREIALIEGSYQLQFSGAPANLPFLVSAAGTITTADPRGSGNGTSTLFVCEAACVPCATIQAEVEAALCSVPRPTSIEGWAAVIQGLAETAVANACVCDGADACVAAIVDDLTP